MDKTSWTHSKLCSPQCQLVVASLSGAYKYINIVVPRNQTYPLTILECQDDLLVEHPVCHPVVASLCGTINYILILDVTEVLSSFHSIILTT